MSTSTGGASPAVKLGERMHGTAIGPDHPDYDAARRGHNQSFDYRPALIARCVDADDVGMAVRFAAAEGLELAVRSGGHSLAGFCSLDGGLVIDLTPMRSVQVNADAGTAAAGGGATAGDLDRATHEFGLATPSATVSTVGLAGFTLGGGIGHLVRAHGLAADNLIGADVVLADGRRVSADEEREPELFWALRGGGGNFGVVTQLRYRLHPVSTVIGGPMLWELAETAEVLELYLRWLPEQPNEVSAFLAVMVVPPADPFPETIRLRPVCALVWCNTAAPELAHAALDAFRAAAPTPLLDAVAELPYPALQSAFDPIAQIGIYNHVSSQYYSSLPGEAAAEFVRFGETTPHWLSFTHLYPLNGAATALRNEDTAWAWRQAAFVQMFLGSSNEPGHDTELREWAHGFSDALAPNAVDAAYSNLLMDEGPAAARASYGTNYERLAAIKAAYDPDNLFHTNQNVRSAT